MLLAPEGDPDAPDIPTPRSYAEAITSPYFSQWQAAMDAKMASWKSTGTYVNAVSSSRAKIVDGMWIFRVKWPPGSPPAFKARYVTRGFSQRQGVDYFQTINPTPKMTILRVLLHVAAQRDYKLHSLDFSIAFLQGSLHEEIWLRCPPGFIGSFPAGFPTCMASRVLVSGLPRSLPPLPPGPAPTCVPCVEGRQRAAPHSSEFPPTEAPLQTLHMDVWGPARVRGQGHERYFLLVVDDYSRYTTVFPLRSKGKVTETFTLPASPQQNGIAERCIGMVMDIARTSMIHAAAPHFLWPIAVQYEAHQLNLQPRVSLPETSPTLLWMGKVGDASAFRVWGSWAFVRDLSADKLSPRATPCVFLGFPPDAPGWQFYHPTSRRVLSSQDVTFDESVPYYRLFPYHTAPLPPPPLFLAPGPPPVDPLPPQGPAPSGVSQADAVEPVEVAVESGAATGAEPAGAGPPRPLTRPLSPPLAAPRGPPWPHTGPVAAPTGPAAAPAGPAAAPAGSVAAPAGRVASPTRPRRRPCWPRRRPCWRRRRPCCSRRRSCRLRHRPYAAPLPPSCRAAAPPSSSRRAVEPPSSSSPGPSRPTAAPPSRPAAEPPSRRAAQQLSRRAAEQPSRRTAPQPSSPAAEQQCRRAAQQPSC
ncbi:unnamed protein product [Closterium sp. NIES-54]